MDTYIGRTLAGKYVLTKLLGEGGLGRVYLGEQLPTRRKVAVKVLHGEIAKEEAAQRRFEREAKAALKISHPNSVAFIDYGMEEGEERHPFLVMEYLKGETLYERLTELSRFPLAAAVGILDQVCGALSFCHGAGIIHRDLKPENIMLCPTKEGEQAKLLDYGVAKLLDDPSVTRTGQMIGTPYYMAPEQIDGRKTIGPAADIYALGIVAYEMLTGVPPFIAVSHLEIFRHHFFTVPPTLQHELGAQAALVPFEPVIARALAKAPEERFSSASELQKALGSALQEALLLEEPERIERTLISVKLPDSLLAEETVKMPRLELELVPPSPLSSPAQETVEMPQILLSAPSAPPAPPPAPRLPSVLVSSSLAEAGLTTEKSRLTRRADQAPGGRWGWVTRALSYLSALLRLKRPAR